MKLNLNEIKSKLTSGSDALVDERILNEDMKSMYEYYKDDVDRPPRIQMYFDKNFGFDSRSFSEAYLSSITGCSVKSELTEDGWLRLFTN